MSSSKLSIEYPFNPDIWFPLFLIRSSLLQSFRELVPRLHGRLLDFGCGSKPYQSLFNVEEYVGVDFMGEGETYSKEKVDVFYDGKHLPFPNQSFDSIFTSEVFEHIFNLPDILKELNRVLRPGGKILISCPFVFGEHEVPNDYARYTSFAVKHMLETAGFSILEQQKSGTHTDAIMQLRIVYWDKYILSKLNRIPVLRSLVRYFIYGLFNSVALLKRRLLSRHDDLYLNNIVLAEKSRDL